MINDLIICPTAIYHNFGTDYKINSVISVSLSVRALTVAIFF